MDGQLTLDMGPALPSGSAIKLYRKIQHQAKKINPDTGQPHGHCFAWYATLAGWMGFSPKNGIRQICRLIKELLDFGWIEKQVTVGIRAWLRPLVEKVPTRVSHTPMPPGEWKEEIKQTVPSMRTPSNDAPVAETVSGSAFDASDPGVSASMSGVMSGVISPVPYYRDSKIPKEVKKKARFGEKSQSGTPKYVLPPNAGPVVSLMSQLEIDEEAHARLLNQVPLEAMRDACLYTLARAKKGLSAGAGYAIRMAEKFATGKWQPSGWYVKEISGQERKEERETAAANKIVEPPKKRVPADWLPGLADEEAREYLNRSVSIVRKGMQCKIDPLSDLVRDQARLLWQNENPGKTAPWKNGGKS